MSGRSERNKQFGKPSVSNLYHGYRKVTKQKIFKKCKCGDENEDYLLIIDPKTKEIEGGIQLTNKSKKSSPTRKNKSKRKKGRSKLNKKTKKNKKNLKTKNKKKLRTKNKKKLKTKKRTLRKKHK